MVVHVGHIRAFNMSERGNNSNTQHGRDREMENLHRDGNDRSVTIVQRCQNAGNTIFESQNVLKRERQTSTFQNVLGRFERRPT